MTGRAYRALATSLLAGLMACTSDLAVPTEPLRLLRVDWGLAYQGEPFEEALRPAGGLRPYRFEVVDGELPPGLDLTAGRLVGTPTAVGRFEFTVQVQDGNLSQALQQVLVDVRPLPTPIVRIEAPATEVRGAVPLVVRVDDARGWQGVRIAVEWDPDAFELGAGPTAADARLALFHQVEAGRLLLEAAALAGPRQGAFALARFSLTPLEAPARLSLAVAAASRYAGGEHVASRLEGAPRPRPAPAPPEDPGDDEEAPAEPPEDLGDDEEAPPAAPPSPEQEPPDPTDDDGGTDLDEALEEAKP